MTHLNTTSRNASSILNQSTDKIPEPKEYQKGEEATKNELKRELLLKINDQRKEYMTLLKGMINGNKKSQNDESNKGLEDAIRELRFNVSKKADEENTKKAVVFL